MKQKSGPGKVPAEQVLKDIRRQTRRQYSAEEKIRIVLEGLRGEENISELCRREGIAVLRLVQGVPRSRQAPTGGRHGARRDIRRGEGSSS
jgi:transposase